jgi:hypothetical protein
MRKPEVEKKPTLLKIKQVSFVAETETDSYHPKFRYSGSEKFLQRCAK